MPQGTGQHPAPAPSPTAAPSAQPTSSPPAGSFDPYAGPGNTTTNPGTTGTDVYGLTPDEEQWTFYTGYSPANDSVNQLRKHLPTEDRPPVSTQQQSYETALDLMKKFAALGTSPNASDRQAFANVQQQLLAIGAYGTSGSASLVRFGTWTDLDAKALINAFKSYQQVAGSEGAQQPVSFEEYLNQASGQSAANGQAGGGGGAGGAPSAPILADPDTLTRYAQMAAENALGRALTKAEISKFVDQFHQQQIQSYTDAANHQGLSAVKDDPRASAIQFVTTNNEQEFGQHQAQGYTDAFLNMFLPQSSTAPSINVDPTAVGY